MSEPVEDAELTGESPEGPKDEMSLDIIKQKCFDSPGYIIFAGYLSKDGKQINSLYRRYHFGFEDAFRANKMMKDEILKDIARDNGSSLE